MASKKKQMPRGLLDPESQAIEEAAAAAPRVPAALGALARGFYEANIEPLLSPVQTARGLLSAGREFVRDPSGTAKAVAQAEGERLRQAGERPESAFEYYGGLLSPFSMLRRAPTMAELDVYHGTPHRFPATETNPLGEFDASKIGTGEGAQAYGHGIYLAESPDVAKDYQVRLSYNPDKMRVGGKQINDLYREIEISAARLPPAKASGEYEKMELLERLMMNENIDEVKKAAAEMSPSTVKWFNKQVEPTFETYGAFYKADLPDEMIDRMLDWDKPLSKDAPQAVKDAFNKLAQTYPDLKEKFFAFYREGRPGSWYYALLNDYAKTGNLVKNQTFASNAMRQAGIPGIKYLDAGSRGQGGSGTRNFVVFPGEEKKVKILERK